MSESITLHPAVTLALQQSETHCALASKATTDAERRAHLSTVRAVNKAAMEMVKGNMPQAVGDGQYLVNSRTNAGVVYRVDVFAMRCDCANQHACWHLAAANVLEEVETAALPIRLSDIERADDDDYLPASMRATDEEMAEFDREAPADADSSHYTEDDLTDEDYADFAELIEH